MTPHIAQIQATVCHYYHIPTIEMTSQRRGRRVARPRQVAMYLSRQLTSMSLPEIGRMFDRDHSTVLHAIHRVEHIMATDRHFAAAIITIRERLSNGVA